ncbi:uncharacterized protein LOC124769433 isoform X3 [Schistocerca piceifrons]|uniref:uncharacterized protein LOC124769433 isoform X3 n=1 Tax=Schistocerca piceifrons TaxID=274613 RepID=UPI001F5FE773|nr:uncharacterized protein LOC124769433 isoform X3 [Schistocerca piceifrons]
MECSISGKMMYNKLSKAGLTLQTLLSLLLLLSVDGTDESISPTASFSTIRQDDICANYNGRRLYLELGERGILTAQNVSSSLVNNGRPSYTGSTAGTVPGYRNTSSHEQCRLELITCPSCVVSITFRQLGLPHSCGGANLVIDSPCRCDYVWVSEPPYEDVSGVPFCGVHPSLPTEGPNAVTYKSHTRTLTLVLLYSEVHTNAFVLEYSAERNKKIMTGSPGAGAIPSSAGNFTHGGVLKSPFFPAPYPRDLGAEYVIACQPELSVSCRVRVLFRDFQLAPTSVMEFYDWNGQRIDVSSGALFRPPVILSTGPSLLIRFYANGGTSLGYKAVYSFVTGNIPEKAIKPVTDCGGTVENFGGAITMMNMVTNGVKMYDCVWLIRPPKNYLHLKTHLYLKVATFMDMAGNTELEILRGVTSEQPVLETLRHPVTQLQPPRYREHVVPVDVGFYVSLRGSFGPTSRLAIVYAAFSYMDCFSGSDTLCQNHRCIPSQLYCDGFDHCGDNSDEPATCYQDWKTEPHQDRHWYSHTPNYYFPKIERYPDLKTATLVFVVSSLGLILLIAALIILLYRMGARARQQRELQNHLQTISELLDGARVEEIVPDDPPVYEAPPDYDDVIKVFPELTRSQRHKRKRESHQQDSNPHSRSTSGEASYNASTFRADARAGRDLHPGITYTTTSEISQQRYITGSAPGLLLLPSDSQFHLVTPAITSRSCQTTPIPDSPPPSYVATISAERSRCNEVPNGNLLLTSYNVPQLPPPITPEITAGEGTSSGVNKRRKRTRESWMLFKDEGSTSANSSDIECNSHQHHNESTDGSSTQSTPYFHQQSPSSLELVQQYSQSSSDESDDNTYQTTNGDSLQIPRSNILTIRQPSTETSSSSQGHSTETGLIIQKFQQYGHLRTNSADHNSNPYIQQISATSSLPGREFESCQSLSAVGGQWVAQNLQTGEQRSLPQSLSGHYFFDKIVVTERDPHIILRNQYDQQFKSRAKSKSERINRQVSTQHYLKPKGKRQERDPHAEKNLCSCEGACGCYIVDSMLQKRTHNMNGHVRSLSAEFPRIGNEEATLSSSTTGAAAATTSEANKATPNGLEEKNINGTELLRDSDMVTSIRNCSSPEAQDFFSNTLIIGGKSDVL